MAAALSASGLSVVTIAPRFFNTSASALVTARENVPIAPVSALLAGRSAPVGFRHRTCWPPSTSATSMFVGLHSPPST